MIVVLLLISLNCFAGTAFLHQPVDYSKQENYSIVIGKRLKLLGVKFQELGELTTALEYCHINTNLLMSIIMVESSFRTDAHNELSSDFGLMQINKFHVRKLKLDKELLRSSVSYNIGVGCNVLGWFLERYSKHEAIMRYNVGTAKNAIKSDTAKNYLARVLKYKNILDGGVK